MDRFWVAVKQFAVTTLTYFKFLNSNPQRGIDRVQSLAV